LRFLILFINKIIYIIYYFNKYEVKEIK
jgi:hypothetical protein